MYKQLIRPALFQLDAERAHHLGMKALKLLSAAPTRCLVRTLCVPKDPRLEVSVAGMEFHNPVGLAAGLDKNADALPGLAALGFGFIELGTVTPRAQLGNPTPRIFRLPQDRALINRMGFPSAGAEAVRQKLAQLKGKMGGAPIGINVGKNKDTPIDEAAQDYVESVRLFSGLGDYFVINVSSPNTPDLRKLQEPARLKAIFDGIRSVNRTKSPVFVKIAPDLNEQELQEILDTVLEAQIAGVIATNTTSSRSGLKTQIEQQGGLSGEPLKVRSREVVRSLYSTLGGQVPIIGVGGISSAVDVWNMLAAGAHAVQIYTALIYEGPALVKRICDELSLLLDRRGVRKISQIIGSAEFI